MTASTYRRPTAKLLASSLGGTPIGVALAGAIIWLMDEYWFTDQPVPDALVVLVWAVVPLITSFLAGYFKKISPQDQEAVLQGSLRPGPK